MGSKQETIGRVAAAIKAGIGASSPSEHFRVAKVAEIAVLLMQGAMDLSMDADESFDKNDENAFAETREKYRQSQLLDVLATAIDPDVESKMP